MIVMLFEYRVDPAHWQAYLREADALRPILAESGDVLAVERFESATEAGKILTLGTFRDEDAVAAWRNTPAHRRAQALGRAKYFTDYRLRMATVTRDYGMDERAGVPADSRALHG